MFSHPESAHHSDASCLLHDRQTPPAWEVHAQMNAHTACKTHELLQFEVVKLPGCLVQAVSVSVSIELMQAPAAACLQCALLLLSHKALW